MEFGNPYDEENEEAFYEQIEKHILTNPPRCFSQVALFRRDMPQSVGDAFKSSFQVGCTCGSNSGQIIGHRLEDFTDGYSGELFISPLSLRCSECKKVAVLFDTKGHGYHAEMHLLDSGEEISQKIRGTGDGHTVLCHSCSKSVFNIFAAVIYWHFDLQIATAEMIWDGEEDSDEVIVRAQDFFNGIVFQLQCQSCNEITIPCDFHKL